MKYRIVKSVVTAMLLLCTTAVSIGGECACSVGPREYSVTAYYVHWISMTAVALRVEDVIAQARHNCSVVHFRLSERFGIGPLLDSLLRSNRNADKTQCESIGFDGRLVFVIQRKNQRDTIAFSRGSCMYVNKHYVPADHGLLRQLAEYLPRWQSDFILADSLSR